MAQPHPTLIGLPPAPSAPDTPSEVPYAIYSPIHPPPSLVSQNILISLGLPLAVHLHQQQPLSPRFPPPLSKMATVATPSPRQAIVAAITSTPHRIASKPSALTVFRASPACLPSHNNALARAPSLCRQPTKAPARKPRPPLSPFPRPWHHRFSACLHISTPMASLLPSQRCLPVAQRPPPLV